MEIIFALFYMSGILKSFLIYYKISLPIDLTLVSVVMLIIGLVVVSFDKKISLSFNKTNLYAFLFLMFFYVWLLISLSYTPSTTYAYHKSLYFIPNIIAFVFPLVYKKFNIAKFFRIIAIIVPLLSVIYLSIYVKLNIEEISFIAYEQIKSLYLVLGTLLGINVIVLTTTNSRIFNKQFVNLGIILISIVLLIVAGARGPLLFVVIIFIMIYGIRLLKVLTRGTVNFIGFKTVLYVIVLMSFIGIVYAFFAVEIDYLVSRAFTRLGLLLGESSTGDMGDSVNTRVDQLELSIELIFSDVYHSVFGYGIGSFGILDSGIDGRSYPHNIFLEIWVELGIIGLLLFLSFLFFVFTKNNQYIKHISMFVLVYLIMNSLKSNSFIDIRVYFAIFGMYMMKTNSGAISSSHNTT